MAIYLLKNRSEDADLERADPYEETLGNIEFIPIMYYHNVCVEELKAALADQLHYDGIIVTSQRAVDAMKCVLHEVPASCLEKPIFTVGPTTAKRLKALNFSNVEGSDSGNGIALASHIIATVPEASNFLFLAGEIHRRQLPDRLIEAGHSVTTRIVYRTTPNAHVGEFIREKVSNEDWIVFFSPSHTQEVLEALRTIDKVVNLAAIGPTTNTFLKDAGFPVKATACDPTARGLKLAIEQASQR